MSPECDFPDFRWREANSDPCLPQKILGLSGGYGYGGVLRKQQIVRADHAVKAEARLLNSQRGCPGGGGGLPGFGVGCPRRSGVSDAEGVAANAGLADN